MVVRTISLADSTGMVRLLNVVNSLQRPVCLLVTQQWEAYRVTLPSDACIYTVSRDSPQMQAHWQDTMGVLHQALSAHRSEQRGQDYGVWLLVVLLPFAKMTLTVVRTETQVKQRKKNRT